MSADIRQFVRPVDTGYADDARGLLEGAAIEGFETAIVFGFKDGKMHIRASASKSTLEILGALDAAKAHVWEAS